MCVAMEVHEEAKRRVRCERCSSWCVAIFSAATYAPISWLGSFRGALTTATT
jgi:hypothetical protein